MIERLRLFFIILLGETVLTAGRVMTDAPVDVANSLSATPSATDPPPSPCSSSEAPRSISRQRDGSSAPPLTEPGPSASSPAAPSSPLSGCPPLASLALLDVILIITTVILTRTHQSLSLAHSLQTATNA
ncbi:hypothetical protein ACWEGQ_10255 [Streptomyces seoulensis]